MCDSGSLAVKQLVKIPLKSKRAMEEEDGIVDSDVVQIRSITLETLLTKKCYRGEGIRLELPLGNPGGLQLTLRQIKTALRAAMSGLTHDIFMLAFKRGDRHIAPCKANNPCFSGDEDYHHVAMTTDKLN